MSRRGKLLGPRVFSLLVRVFLPRSFRDQVASQHVAAFTDAYRATVAAKRSRLVAVFWLREFVGLLRLAFTEHRDAVVSGLRRSSPDHHSNHSRNRDHMIGTLRKDLAFAVRMILRTPIVSAIAILSLAVGVSANTTIFSVLHSWLLRPLPYPNSDRIVMLYQNNRDDADDTDPVAPANYFDWVEQTTSFEDVVASSFELANLTDVERPEQLTISLVTPNFFRMLGAEPLVGRTFGADDGLATGSRVAVISEVFWNNRFGRDPAIIGKTITLDGTAHTVVGVIPERFDFLLGTVSAWTATDFRDRRDDRVTRSLQVTALLHEGVSLEQARSELSATAARLESMYPETNEGWGTSVLSLRRVFPGPTDRGLINILMTVVLLVLFVACANIASLLMAKTEARQREMAIRAALGAGKPRIIRQLLTESVVMAVIGGVGGLLLTAIGINGVRSAMPDELPAYFSPEFSGAVVAYGILISVIAGLTFGITPATQAISGDIKTPLMEGGRGGTASRKTKRLRQAFVIVEFAVALTVLMGAALLTDVFRRRLSIAPGFNPANLLTLEVTLPEHRYGEPATVVGFLEDVERSLEAIPGSQGFALTNTLPRARATSSSSFTMDGVDIEENRAPEALLLSVNTSYFATLEIPVISGRGFTSGDRADGTPVVMINQRLADLYFPDQDPLGRRITVADTSREIVGLAQNIAQERLTGLTPTSPSIYFPMAQRPQRRFRVVMRGEGDPYDLAEPIQNAVWTLDPDQPVTAVRMMDEHIALQLAGPDVLAKILFIVGFLALALSGIGIYGVMAYAVTRQTNEIGIRMALGAKRLNVMSQMSRQGAALAGLGLALGLPLSGAVVLMISSSLSNAANADGFGNVQILSAGPLMTVAGILVAVALLASYLPARRATKIDPVVALQHD